SNITLPNPSSSTPSKPSFVPTAPLCATVQPPSAPSAAPDGGISILFCAHFAKRPQLFWRYGANLRSPERGVLAIFRQQGVVSAVLDDLTVREHQDAVEMGDRREAMGDHEDGLVAHGVVESRLNLPLRDRVQAGRRLVEHQHRSVLEHDAG